MIEYLNYKKTQMSNWTLKEPKYGDIIRVEINKDYHHFGIYVSDDEVIQYGLLQDIFKEAKDVVVLKSTIDEFRNKKFVEVREYSLKEKLLKNKPDKVVSKARARLGEANYNLYENNCSHFVNECVFNKHISDETNKK